jgi:hypothetical protein
MICVTSIVMFTMQKEMPGRERKTNAAEILTAISAMVEWT